MKSRSCRLAVEALEDRWVPSAVAYGDFNRDGLMDVAAATNSTTIAVSLANPDGTYTASAILTAPKNLPIGGVNVDDYNGDGNLDISSGGLANNRFYSHTWLGNGDGTFGNRDTQKGNHIPKWFVQSEVEAGSGKSAASHSHDRPFHLEESGAAAFNPDGTISGAASGQAAHLGAFTLHDTSTIISFEDGILSIAGEADLEAANGDHLCASFSGSVNFATGEGTLNFEWTGGTGRFTEATGTTQWQIHVNTTDLTYTAVADGVINY